MIDVNKANPNIKEQLQELVDKFERYDISTFKNRLRDILELSDLRAPEDQTDFTFMGRRDDDS